MKIAAFIVSTLVFIVLFIPFILAGMLVNRYFCSISSRCDQRDSKRNGFSNEADSD
ncbi:hypothetical protein GCM10011571_33800 [Marinithermofilum abyssi]|uniref:Uncharacterized protein n=1 Tax=Marinithermofilum abyssi TaxID=1571185 RepID=A0A8J2VKU9_9BACL|nr:hypothetical protein GCM10011571_33800 [Marinithermofilum abyssi]